MRAVLLLTLGLGGASAFWHGWRDQYVRVSPQLMEGVKKMRRRLAPGTDFSDEVKNAAKAAVQAAEKIAYLSRSGKAVPGSSNATKPRSSRRRTMDVVNDEANRKATVNGVELPDMSLFDCPWSASLHPYLDLNAPFAVDGGLCLPYQEIPFPFSIGIDPVDTTLANIHCPGPNWNPDALTCTTDAGEVTDCLYEGDVPDAKYLKQNLAYNYGCAAGDPGWGDAFLGGPFTAPNQAKTPICQKTYVDDCKYSTKETRKWSYNTDLTKGELTSFAMPENANRPEGYTIAWVLSEVTKIRNALGADTVMATDLGAPNWTFPTDIYEALFGQPAGSTPPLSGAYPSAYVKAQFKDDMTVDTSKDGICSVEDAKTQWMDCGIPCPVGDEARMAPSEMGGFQAAVLTFMFVCAVLGAIAFFFVGKDSSRFFVGGRNLNIFVVTATLASQSLDSNAALGNIDLGYFYHWWDGACLPIGLGLSLVLNGIFFAKPLNEMQLLTLPDLFARKFGVATEVLFSFLGIISFLALLGGNLVGSGRIIAYLFGLDPVPGIWITTFAIWLYTIAGGLISVAYTDCAQALVGWLGLVIGSAWVLNNMPTAAGQGIAYPLGDKNMVGEQMTDADVLDPIPNAIHFNWITIFVLGFGNLAALDFQARVFGAKGPKTAVAGCILGGVISWIVGITFSFTSGAARALYGPSSPYAEFVPDSCSQEITIIGCFGGPDTGYFDGATGTPLSPGDPGIPGWRGPGCGATVLNGVPTCGEWKPDPYAALKMFTCTKEKCHYLFDFDGTAGIGVLNEEYHPMNPFIGGWVLVAIVAASMSTGDGAILAMSTVFSHNVMRKMPVPFFQDDKNLLVLARLVTIIWAPLAALIASTNVDTSGYLLIVAFDIMLAGSVIPMFAAVYWKSCKPLAAFMAMFIGSLSRLILEFAVPKDGLLLLVGKYALSFGPGAYGGINVETAEPLPGWCPQFKLADWTGIDSLIAPAISLVVLLIFQLVPSPKHKWFTPVAAGATETSTTNKVADSGPVVA